MSGEEYQLLLIANKDVSGRVQKAASGRQKIAVQITVAEGLQAALKLLGTRPVDAVLLDLALEEAPGIRGCLRLRQADRALPVIALARRRDEQDAWAALHAGAQDFLLLEDLQPVLLERAVRYSVERQRAAGKLASEEALLQSILQNLSEGVVVADRHEKLLLVNPSARRMLGIGSIAGLPTDLFGLYRADTGDPLSDRDRPMARAVRGETVTDVEIFHKNAAAPEGVYLSVNARPMHDENGVVTGGIVSIRDISERKRAEQELAQLALYDRLTAIPNRSFFVESLGKAISRARRANKQLAILLLDIDRFKRINEELGQERGDQLLQEVARRLSDGLRAGDFLARLGGDEFAILFEDYEHSARAAGLAEKVQEILAPAMQLGDHEVKVTASLGISNFPDCGEDPVTLLKTADIAMYRAKESGRNTYHFYSRAVHAEVSRRAQLEVDLRRALNKDQFELAWQPIVDLENGRVVALEALLRWRHPEHGLVRPVEFVPILEAAGLMHQVGERVLAEACSQVADWRRELNRLDLAAAVNVSVRQLEHPRFVERVERILASAGLPASALVVEFREDALGPAVPDGLDVLALLAGIGVRLALDDFGSGWLSLQRLRRLPLEWLKLEREFVQGLPVDQEDCTVADAALALATLLRADLVAEAVESPAQLEYLQTRGCRFAQGFLFSAPVPSAEIPALIVSGAKARDVAAEADA